MAPPVTLPAASFMGADGLDRQVQRHLSHQTAAAWRGLSQYVCQGLDADTVDPQQILARFRTRFRQSLVSRVLVLLPALVRRARRLAQADTIRRLQGHIQRQRAHGRTGTLPWLSAAAALPTEEDRAFLEEPDPWQHTPVARLAYIEALTHQDMTRFLQRWVGQYEGEKAALADLGTLDLARQAAQVPAKLQRLERLVRRSLSMDPYAKRQALAALAQFRATIPALQSPGLRGAYRQAVADLSKAVRTNNTAAVRTALDTFVVRRTKWRVEQLLRNEVHRANQQAVVREYAKHDFVQALQWRVHPSLHTHLDSCDLMARVNIGLGPGIFYKQDPPRKQHVNCRCRIDPVLAPVQDIDARPFVPSNPAAYAHTLELLRGPLRKDADRLGRQGDRSGFATLLLRVPQTIPAGQ